MSKPKVLFVFTKAVSKTSTRYGGFVKRLQKHSNIDNLDIYITALENLRFTISDDQKASVLDITQPELKIDDMSFVYFKSWQALPELAASLAFYLEGMGIPYEDRQVRHEYISKTANYMRMWADGVRVPLTVWGTPQVLRDYINEKDASYPVVIKAVHGQKGKDNYLAKDVNEAKEILNSTSVEMLLQGFIPNNGDYRVGVYGNQAAWVIYRKASGSSHINNTSNGGVATYLPLEQVDPEVLLIAEQAALACDLAFSGVDVVTHAETGEHYIFEANQGSQVVTGAFTDTNIPAFCEGLNRMVQHRYIKDTKDRQVIGRHVTVVIELDSEQTGTIRAKVDSGAYQNSLHAENVVQSCDKGGDYVSYEVPLVDSDVVLSGKTYKFWRANVTNSFGQSEERYVVPMSLRIRGKVYSTRVSLSKRANHKFPLLLGRKLLRGNFIINVELADSKDKS